MGEGVKIWREGDPFYRSRGFSSVNESSKTFCCNGIHKGRKGVSLTDTSGGVKIVGGETIDEIEKKVGEIKFDIQKCILYQTQRNKSFLGENSK
jgi:hypothetical protein